MYTPVCMYHAEYMVRISRIDFILPKKHTQTIRNNRNSRYSNHIREYNAMNIMNDEKKRKAVKHVGKTPHVRR